MNTVWEQEINTVWGQEINRGGKNKNRGGAMPYAPRWRRACNSAFFSRPTINSFGEDELATSEEFSSLLGMIKFNPFGVTS